MKKASLMASVIAACAVTAADASVVWSIDDDGSGGTRMQLSGTYSVIAPTGSVFFTPLPSTLVGTSTDRLEWYHASVGGATQAQAIFAPSSGSGPILASLIPGTTVLGTVFDSLFISIVSGGTGTITGYNGAFFGSLSEDVTVSSLPYASFNEGIWEWGNPSTPNQGIRLEIGQNAITPVPLPGSLALLIGGLAAGAVLRRRSHAAPRSA